MRGIRGIGLCRRDKGLTSAALHTSFSVLQRAIPSSTAPASSSTYFSKDSVSMSLIIWSRFSAPTDWRMRLINAVCRFREESSAFAGAVTDAHHRHSPSMV